MKVFFQVIKESLGKLFTENGEQRKTGHPRYVKDTTFGRSEELLHCVWGRLGHKEKELRG